MMKNHVKRKRTVGKFQLLAEHLWKTILGEILSIIQNTIQPTSLIHHYDCGGGARFGESGLRPYNGLVSH